MALVTLIRGNTQIRPGTIDLEKLMSPFIGASTGNWDITGGNLDATITGIPDPINDYDVVNKHYVDQLLLGRIWKSPVIDVYSDTNIDITAPPDTVDGVTLNVGDRIAMFNQTDPTQDGVWIYNGAGNALTRAPEWAEGLDAAGWTFVVDKGTVYKDSIWTVTNDKGSAIIGTDDLSVIRTGGTGVYTFQNALTKTGDIVEWGGTLIKNTTIDGGGSYSVTFQETDFYINRAQTHISVVDTAMEFNYTDIFSESAKLRIDSTYRFDLKYSNSSGDVLGFETIGQSGIRVGDDVYGVGLFYKEDYHTSWIDRSLVDKQYVDTFDKVTVRAKADDNVDITAAPDTIGGVTLAAGDLVLLVDQTTTTEDGIYVFNGAGNAMTRAPYYEEGVDIKGLNIFVLEGNSEQSLFTIANTGTAIIGTDDLSVQLIGGKLTSLIFQNAITNNSGIVEWGGDLVKTTTIYMHGYGVDFFSDVATAFFRFTVNDAANSQFADYNFASDYMKIVVQSSDGSIHFGQFMDGLTSNTYFIGRWNFSGDYLDTGFQINDTDHITVRDTVSSFGMRYIDDYSANGTQDPRWIPDWGTVQSYVDNSTNRVYGTVPTISDGDTSVSVDITGYTASNVVVYYDGSRLSEAAGDYTITSNTDTLTIDFSPSGLVLSADDVVILDYNLQPN